MCKMLRLIDRLTTLGRIIKDIEDEIGRMDDMDKVEESWRFYREEIMPLFVRISNRFYHRYNELVKKRLN